MSTIVQATLLYYIIIVTTTAASFVYCLLSKREGYRRRRVKLVRNNKTESVLGSFVRLCGLCITRKIIIIISSCTLCSLVVL